jgi:uncharacterized protein YbjT (DUF2867 family)
VISAARASTHSGNFYLRTKGDMEEGLMQMNMEALDILQPGALLGWRREIRPLEVVLRVLMPIVNPFLLGSMTVYRGISGRTVALAMLGAARSGRRGTSRYTYAGIVALARKGTARAAL